MRAINYLHLTNHKWDPELTRTKEYNPQPDRQNYYQPVHGKFSGPHFISNFSLSSAMLYDDCVVFNS